MKPPAPTKAQLKRKILELEAQLVHVYHFAESTIDKASIDHCLGSGVLMQLSFLGGKEVIPPVVIKDGLSPQTIAAIKDDFKRSYTLSTFFKPKGI